MFHGAFGWVREGQSQDLTGLACCGEYGLDGFGRFVGYFVQYRSLQGAMIESKIIMIISAIELEWMLTWDFHSIIQSSTFTGFQKNGENLEKSAPEPIEIRDEGDDLAESDVVYVTDKIKSARVDEIDRTKEVACKEEKVHSNRDWIVINR
jgi:hypothetical protein